MDFPDITSDKIEELNAAKNTNPYLAVIFTTMSNQLPDLSNETFDALEYLRKPFPIGELFLRVSNVLKSMELRKELDRTLDELGKLKESNSRKID